MQNINNWEETKFILNSKGKFISNPEVVAEGSRFITDLVALEYQKNIKKYAKGKLLDLGCGFVPMYAIYKDYIDENICIDWENSLHPNDFLDIKQDIHKTLQVENDSFDTVICSDVLEHIYKPKHLFKEIARVLKKDGVLLLNTPFCYWEHETPYDYHRYTQYTFQRLCKENNLTVIDIIPISNSWGVIVDILSKCTSRKKPRDFFIRMLIPCFKRRSIKMSERKKKTKQPLAYFLIAQKDN